MKAESPRTGQRDRTTDWSIRRRVALAAVALVATANCIDTTAPVAPDCAPVIGLAITPAAIEVDDTFTASASHSGDACLSNLQWTATGPVTLRAAEATSATFRADDSGFATIRVQNDKGSIGVLEIEVEEGEEG
jgi:hypothetical protein